MCRYLEIEIVNLVFNVNKILVYFCFMGIIYYIYV